ncbi:MAG: hypothetical protein KAJ16_01440 [Calditrichia bacterium]|nr:hypothetical protein [Calditrichia bacterium]
MPENLKTGLIKTLILLKDYLPVIVLGGGWVPLMYQQYFLGNKSIFPILTKDIDLLVNNKVPVIKGVRIDTILTGAGLEQTFYGSGIQPIIHYNGKIGADEISVEFLTDLKGKGDKYIIEVQQGLNAEALRYISLLVDHTMQVKIDDVGKYGVKTILRVKVPIPGAFVFQKGLVFPLRKEQAKKEKDLYYIFGVIIIDELRNQVIAEIKELSTIYPSWFKTFIKNLLNNFDDVGSNGVLSVLNQKSGNQFVDHDKEQFKNLVFFTFQHFLKAIQ